MDFVGRSEELDQLQAALAAAAADEGRFVLVQGESGVGKTTLVRTFIASAESRSTILYGVRGLADAVAAPAVLFDGLR